jgi:hypothetical protein
MFSVDFFKIIFNKFHVCVLVMPLSEINLEFENSGLESDVFIKHFTGFLLLP